MRLRVWLTLAVPIALGLAACDKTNSGTDGGTGDSGGEQPDGCVPPPSELADGCSSDDDCTLARDCCDCFAYKPAAIDPVDCGGSCAADKCEEWGITEAVCRDGQCVAVGLSCNQALLTCNAATPICDAGFLPQVSDGCFTGACLPLEACDWVPDCSACAEGELCMHEMRGGCDHVRCVANLAMCQGESPCCTGESWCGAAQCTPTDDGFMCGG